MKRNLSQKRQVPNKESLKKKDSLFVLNELYKRGMVIKTINEESVSIKCPWSSAIHPGKEDSATYSIPKEGRTYGVFKCCCPECSDKDIIAFLKILGIKPIDAIGDFKTTILYNEGDRDAVIKEIFQVLARTGEIFELDGALWRIQKEGSRYKPTKLGRADFLIFLDQKIVLSRFDKRENGRVVRNVPPAIVMLLMELKDKAPIPRIERIVDCPFITKGGRLVNQTGFNNKLGVFSIYDPKKFPVPENPSEAQVRSSFKAIQDIFGSFGFENPEDEAVALCGVLTAVVRRELEFAPLFLVTAPTSGAGKSLLCKCIGSFASQEGAIDVPFSNFDDELLRQLITTLQGNPRAIVFDNLVDNLQALPTLCTIFTSEFIAQRKMRSNTSLVKASTRCLIMANGINIKPVKDMIRRTVICKLKNVPHFNPIDPSIYILEHREEYVTHALTVVYGCLTLNLGKNIQKEREFGGFNTWWEWCARPVTALTGYSPLRNTLIQKETDSDSLVLIRFLELVKKYFGYAYFKASDISKKFSSMEDHEKQLFDQGLKCLNDGKLNTRILGNWIADHCNTPVNGYELRKTSTPAAKRYCLIKTKM